MEQRDIDIESDKDSLESIAAFDDMEENNVPVNNPEIEAVRESIRNWKLRELERNTMQNKKPNGLGSLRDYVAKSAKLYYDLNTYLNTSQNKEQNMKDSYYVNIVTTIGQPASLSFPFRLLLDHILQRDLLELPLTVEPKIVNHYTKEGLKVDTQFPDEE